MSFLFSLLDHYSCLVDRGIIILEETSSIKKETQRSVKVIMQSGFWWRLEFSYKGINYIREYTRLYSIHLSFKIELAFSSNTVLFFLSRGGPC